MAMTTYKFEDHSLMPFMDPDLDVVYEEYGVRGTMITVNYTSSNYDAASYKSVARFINSFFSYHIAANSGV